jgi:hypothetical protein
LRRKRVTLDDAEEAFLDQWMFEQPQWAYWNVHHRAEKVTERGG